MARLTLMVSDDQLRALGKLVDALGVAVYRDTKHELGLGRLKKGQSLTRLEADMLILKLSDIFETGGANGI